MRWPRWRWRPRQLGQGAPLAEVHRSFVAVDLETTGLDPRTDAMVAVAAIPFMDGVPTPGYVSLVNPARPIPADAIRVHGITDAMVAEAPGVEAALRALEPVLAGRVLVAHGVAFDLGVIDRERRARGLPRLPNPALCTMRLAAVAHPAWVTFDLDRVAARLGVAINGRHTAEGDAVAAGNILMALMPGLTARGALTVGDLLWLQQRPEIMRLVAGR